MFSCILYYFDIAKKIFSNSYIGSCTKTQEQGTILSKWNSLVKNHANEQTIKQNTN